MKAQTTRKLLASLVAALLLLTAAPLSAMATGSGAPADPDELVKGFNELRITAVVGDLSTSPRKPVEDLLTPIWREKTRVIPEFIEVPPGQDVGSWLQMQIIAETVPDVLASGSMLTYDGECMAMLKAAGLLKEIKLEDMKQYMPRTAAHLADLGLSMEDWYRDSVDPSDGKLWVMPNLPSPFFKEENRDTPFGRTNLGTAGYGIWFRDDILKQIYPQAKSEVELRELWVKNGGMLTMADIVDIPLNSPEDLYTYLTKVKEMNIQENGYTIIPGHIIHEASRGAMDWSLFSLSGISVSYCAQTIINESQNRFEFYPLSPEWKAYCAFMNKAFNDGLFGDEFFIQRDEQRTAKIINGEYAVVGIYHEVEANREAARAKGMDYGWRYYPIFNRDMNTDYQGEGIQRFYLTNLYYNTKGFNAKTITDDMMPQILNWMDWQYSAEAAELRTWGTPDMYEGEGLDRRFKPEFKKVEEYMLSGKADDTGDGWYYGMQGPMGTDITIRNHEVYGFTQDLFMSEQVYAPIYVYPPASNSFNQYNAVNTAWQQYGLAQTSFFKVLPTDDRLDALKAQYDKHAAALGELNVNYNSELDDLWVKAISGPVADFDKNYEAYIRVYNGNDYQQTLKVMIDAWQAYWTVYYNEYLEKVN